jgi:putative effector of murein hydrolase
MFRNPNKTKKVYKKMSSRSISDTDRIRIFVCKKSEHGKRRAFVRKGSNAVAEGTQKEEAKDRVDDLFYEQANRRHEQKLIENEEAKRRTSVSGNENRVGEKGTVLGDATRLFASTLALFILDKVVSKEVAQAGIKFPGPLVVMFAVIIVLLALDAVAKNEEESLSKNVLSAFKPAMDWITSWLPVFYVPSLVTLPLVVSTMEVQTLGKIVGLLAGGFVVTCAFSAKLATKVREFTGVEMQELPAEKAKEPTSDFVKQLVGFTTMMAFLFANWLPATDQYQSFFVTVGLVGATVSSLLIGNVKDVKAKMNPIVTCAALSNLGVYIMGLCTGAGYQATLKLYKSGVSFNNIDSLSSMGAGDILMAFLGSVIVSFAFKVYGARKIIKRHAVEIFTCLLGTSIFSMFSTAFLGKLIGLTPAVTLALVPRSVTVALAMPVTISLGHPEMVSLTAAAVVLTGLLGSALATKVLDASNANDPVSRGMATAAASHGLGTAALVSKEPEALPYAALSYALSGIVTSVLAATPVITAALIGIASA